MENIIIQGIGLQKFEALIEEAVKRAFAGSKQMDVASTSGSKPLNREEAAKYLGISKQTLTKWREDGKIKGSHVGRKVYFFEEDLNASIKCQTYKKRKNNAKQS